MSRGKITEQELSTNLKNQLGSLDSISSKLNRLVDASENVRLVKTIKDNHGTYTFLTYRRKSDNSTWWYRAELYKQND